MHTKKLLLSILLLMTCNVVLADFPTELEKLYYPEKIQDFHIKIKAPEIAEYKEKVRIVIESLQLPSLQSYVKEVSLYLSRQPTHPISTYKLSSVSIAEGISSDLRIPHGRSTLYAIARLSNGNVIGGQAVIKATYGCAGDG